MVKDLKEHVATRLLVNLPAFTRPRSTRPALDGQCFFHHGLLLIEAKGSRK